MRPPFRFRLARAIGALSVALVPVVLPLAAGDAVAGPYTVQKIYEAPQGVSLYYFDMNDLGEVVWTQMPSGPATGWELYSSTRGRLTNDAVADCCVSINNAGQIAWQSGRGTGGNPSDWEIVFDGTRLTTNGTFDGEPVVNNSGEVAWIGSGGIQTNLRGQVVSGYAASLDMNDSGEIVYRDAANRIVSTVQGILGTGDHPDINNLGEVVWYGTDGKMHSSVRGILGPAQLLPEVNDRGEISYAKFTGSQFEVAVNSAGTETFVSPGMASSLLVALNNMGAVAFIGVERGLQGIYVATPGGRVPEPTGLSLLLLAAAAACLTRRRIGSPGR